MWLGMSKIGVVGALVNFNLRKTPLAHCIKAAEAKAVIFASELAEGKSELHNDPKVSKAIFVGRSAAFKPYPPAQSVQKGTHTERAARRPGH